MCEAIFVRQTNSLELLDSKKNPTHIYIYVTEFPLPDDIILIFNVLTYLLLTLDRLCFQVFEVIGKLEHPFYVVRFNSEEDIKDRGVEIGLKVYFAPDPAPAEADITHFIFNIDRLKMSASLLGFGFVLFCLVVFVVVVISFYHFLLLPYKSWAPLGVIGSGGSGL